MICDQLYGQFWRSYHELMRRRYLFLVYYEMFYKYVRSIWLITSVSFTVTLLSFCFHDLSITESGVLKSPTIVVWGSMCALSFCMFPLHMWACLYLGHRYLELRVQLGDFSFDEYEVSFPIFFDNFWLKVYFTGY